MEPPESSSSEGSPAHPRAARPLRRASFAPLNSLEPRIVVEESLDGDDEDADGAGAAPHPAFAVGDLAGGGCGDDSPAADENPYLLSPWRDTRKSSLPTPACSSGITASQVRRLSERGPESGPSPREQEFLATLSATPGPQPGGRRHSVVISRVPPPSLVMFGRGRRESIAAFSAAACRSEALASSTHNLQLDLMDDLLEFKAAKKVKQLEEEALRWGGGGGGCGGALVRGHGLGLGLVGRTSESPSPPSSPTTSPSRSPPTTPRL